MTDLSTSELHVAVLLGGLRAADHHISVGGWPSLLVVTDRVSLQLDPAEWLTRSEASRISGRLLSEVMRWDACIRGRNDIALEERSATDPADGLTTTGRPLRGVTGWDAPTRGQSATTYVQRAVTDGADHRSPTGEAPGPPVVHHQGGAPVSPPPDSAPARGRR